MPRFCAGPEAPDFCIGTLDWVVLGVGLAGWALIYLMKWLDPARRAAEQITGLPWWRL
jgi:hypothetical protein